MNREQIEAMTSEQVNAHLAEKVMGWHRDGGWWCDAKGNTVCLVRDWNPAHVLDDAMRAAEKVGWVLRHGDMLTFFELHYGSRWHAGWCYVSGSEHITASAETPALAVCRAVIAAHEAGKEGK